MVGTVLLKGKIRKGDIHVAIMRFVVKRPSRRYYIMLVEMAYLGAICQNVITH